MQGKVFLCYHRDDPEASEAKKQLSSFCDITGTNDIQPGEPIGKWRNLLEGSALGIVLLSANLTADPVTLGVAKALAQRGQEGIPVLFVLFKSVFYEGLEWVDFDSFMVNELDKPGEKNAFVQEGRFCDRAWQKVNQHTAALLGKPIIAREVARHGEEPYTWFLFRDYLKKHLDQYKQNITRTAHETGIPRAKLVRLLQSDALKRAGAYSFEACPLPWDKLTFQNMCRLYELKPDFILA